MIILWNIRRDKQFVDAFISMSIVRPLQVSDLNLGDTISPQEMRVFCDSFAHRLIERYLSGSITWSDADLAVNNIYVLMVQNCGDQVPEYAWEVYLAFDAGECIAPGGDATTRPLIEAMKVARPTRERSG
jgi:hypothetical protein